jgi:hypothetical protein
MTVVISKSDVTRRSWTLGMIFTVTCRNRGDASGPADTTQRRL